MDKCSTLLMEKERKRTNERVRTTNHSSSIYSGKNGRRKKMQSVNMRINTRKKNSASTYMDVWVYSLAKNDKDGERTSRRGGKNGNVRRRFDVDHEQRAKNSHFSLRFSLLLVEVLLPLLLCVFFSFSLPPLLFSTSSHCSCCCRLRR